MPSVPLFCLVAVLGGGASASILARSTISLSVIRCEPLSRTIILERPEKPPNAFAMLRGSSMSLRARLGQGRGLLGATSALIVVPARDTRSSSANCSSMSRCWSRYRARSEAESCFHQTENTSFTLFSFMLRFPLLLCLRQLLPLSEAYSAVVQSKKFHACA
jgi:hypothetical protein